MPIFIGRGAPLRCGEGLASPSAFRQDVSQSRRVAVAPAKISKTTPCKVAGGRRHRRFEPILDTSGKSEAPLHHRTIRQTTAGAQRRRAVRRDVWRNSLTYNRTRRCDTFNASMRSYSARVLLKTICRRKSKAATKRKFLPSSRVVDLRASAGGRRLATEP